MTLDVAGAACGNVIVPDQRLKDYDLVFGTARCALEAIVCGCAVILLNSTHSGPLVTQENWRELYRQNFSHSAIREPIKEELISEQITRFDPDDISGLTSEVCAEVGMDAAVENYVKLYESVREMHEGAEAEDEFRSVSVYLENHFSYPWITRARTLEKDVATWKASAETAHQGWAQLGEEYQRLARENERLEEEIASRRKETE